MQNFYTFETSSNFLKQLFGCVQMYVCLVTEVIKKSSETAVFQNTCLQDEGDQKEPLWDPDSLYLLLCTNNVVTRRAKIIIIKQK